MHKGNKILFLQILIVFGKVKVCIHAPAAFEVTKVDASSWFETEAQKEVNWDTLDIFTFTEITAIELCNHLLDKITMHPH